MQRSSFVHLSFDLKRSVWFNLSFRSLYPLSSPHILPAYTFFPTYLVLLNASDYARYYNPVQNNIPFTALVPASLLVL
jgi:hypothetical protein